MKTILKSLAYLLAIILISNPLARVLAQEKGSNTQEAGIDQPFNTIKLTGVYKVNIVQGDHQHLKVESDDEITGKVTPVVHAGSLSLETSGIKNPSKLNITITYKELSRIESSGATSVTGKGVLKADKLDLEITGASKVDLQLDVNSLNSEVSGAGQAKLSGRAGFHRLEVSGAANMRAFDLETSKANAEVSGAANARLNVKDEVTGETSGVGKLMFKQEPKIRNIERSGVSKIYTNDSVEATGNTIVVGGKTMTIKDDGVIIEADSAGQNPLEINNDGVKMIIKEKNKDGKTETKVLVIDNEGVKIENKESNTSEHFWKRKGRKFDGHWAGFEMGVNTFVDKDGAMGMNGKYEFLDLKMEKCIDVRINLFEQNFNLIQNHLGLFTGLGFEYNNYRFANDVVLGTNENGITGFHDKTKDYKKSKLVVNYLNLPLMLEYQTNPNNNTNSFHIAAGMTLGWRIGSHTKVVYNDDKHKVRDDFDLNPFKYDATVRIGWGVVNLYGTYALNTLFKDNKGPEVYPVTMGITLVSF